MNEVRLPLPDVGVLTTKKLQSLAKKYFSNPDEFLNYDPNLSEDINLGDENIDPVNTRSGAARKVRDKTAANAPVVKLRKAPGAGPGRPRKGIIVPG